jgi:uncharacterized membrane protein YobD (UPF0266 family)
MFLGFLLIEIKSKNTLYFSGGKRRENYDAVLFVIIFGLIIKNHHTKNKIEVFPLLFSSSNSVESASHRSITSVLPKNSLALEP